MHGRYPILISLLFSIALSGCAGLSKRNTPMAPETPVYLDSEALHQRRVEAFLDLKQSPSEEDKISFLLDSIQASQNKFIRNGSEYPASAAIQWLKWKRNHKQFRNQPVVTAADFVSRVANQSLRTGKPYGVILPDGNRKKLEDILLFELASLELSLKQRLMLKKASEIQVPVNQPALPPDSHHKISTAPLQTASSSTP